MDTSNIRSTWRHNLRVLRPPSNVVTVSHASQLSQWRQMSGCGECGAVVMCMDHAAWGGCGGGGIVFGGLFSAHEHDLSWALMLVDFQD